MSSHNVPHEPPPLIRTHSTKKKYYPDYKTEIIALKKEPNFSDHFLSPQQLEVHYRTNCETGLTEEIVKENMEEFGPNVLKNLKGNSYFKILRHNLCGWFQCLLWFGAVLNFCAYFFSDMMSPGEGTHSSQEYLYLGIIITLTVLLTGLFGFYVEAKNKSVMSGFERLIPPNATVIRQGVKKVIPNTDVTIGDIVEMRSGEVVPADVRLVSCTNFKTDMSSLTGESIPVSHVPNCTDANPLESKNMVYFTCPIIEGVGKGIVIAIGEYTELGTIAGLTTGLEKVETPISKEITHFIKILCGVSLFFGVVFFTMVFTVTKNWLISFQYMLGIILANVPEGLIVTLTVCLTMSARQLKKKNCLTKSLQAVGTLGSTSCICSDKTGTLTQNTMSVSHLFCNWHIYDESDHGHGADASFNVLCTAACLNLKAMFTFETISLPIAKRKVLGDASETAILKYMEANRSATVIQVKHPKVAEIPFSSVYKYQVTIHKMPTNQSNYYLIMKGGPEVVLDHADKFLSDEGVTNLTQDIKNLIKSYFVKLANMGERVIGYCDLHLSASEYPDGYVFNTDNRNFPIDNLVFIGAISMMDPPRVDIEKVIALCRSAGIKIIMLTGDHPVTALSISRRIGIINTPTAYDYAFENHIDIADIPSHINNYFKAAVVTGDDLRRLSVSEVKDLLEKYEEVTFARISPQQKLLIVENLQELKYVVAVTGDGVNDSPALKKADIGVAMGITGTEVAKQAADMILLDDNFASIVLGVEEGRRIFDNLKKTIAYTLTSNTPEMMPFIIYACFGMPLPLTLILILIVNVGTDLLPAMSLAYEESEEDVMDHPPRKPDDHLVERNLIFMAYFQVGLIQFCASMFAYFVVFAEDGFFPSSLIYIRDKWELPNEIVKDSFGRVWFFQERKLLERRAQTAYFVSVCFTQISDLIICKTRRISLLKKKMTNHVLNVSILLDIIAAVFVTYVPFSNHMFNTQPLQWHDFFLSMPFALVMIFVDELRRYLIRNNISSWVKNNLYY